MVERGSGWAGRRREDGKGGECGWNGGKLLRRGKRESERRRVSPRAKGDQGEWEEEEEYRKGGFGGKTDERSRARGKTLHGEKKGVS